MQDHDDVGYFIRSFTGSHAYIIDYLAEEVVQRQSAEIRSFLLRTSILERMNGPLCDAVTGRSDSQPLLEQLEHANLFITPLDDRREWYRYHHLFAEVLQAHLRRDQPELVPELHRRASAWHEHNDLPAEAIHHAIATGSTDQAVPLIEQHGLSLIARGESRAIQAALEALPAPLFLDRPMLGIVQAAGLTLENRLEAAELRLQEVERALAGRPSDDQTRHWRGIMLTIRAELTRYAGDVLSTVNLAQEAAALLPEADLTSRQRAIDYVALDFLLTGDMVRAAETYPDELITSTRASGDLVGHFSAVSTIGWAHVYQGRLREAARLFQLGLEEVAMSGVQHFFADVFYHLGLGGIQYEWNQLDEAEAHLKQGLQLASGLSIEANGALVGSTALARIQQARGNPAGALKTLADFAQTARQHHFAAALIARGEAMRARVLLMQGQVDLVWRWIEASGLAIDDGLSFPLEQTYLALARALIARQNSRAALHLLARWLHDAESKGRFNSVIEIQLLRALAFQSAGHTLDVANALEHALTLAEPEGYIRTFVDEGEPMQLLIADFRVQIEKQASPLRQYVDKLLAAFSTSDSSPPDQQISTPTPLRFGDYSQQAAITDLVELPSERELEVLRLIDAGLSNREIAERLIVGLGTIKTHINNLYRKLDVNSRTQALARARELGLL